MLPLADVRRWTGYERGRVTALATAKHLDVYLDASAFLWDEIAVSAGSAGAQLVLRPTDYVAATGASTADLT